MKLLKVLGIIFGLFAMAGFGMCSLFGLAMGLAGGHDEKNRNNILLIALGGLLIAALIGWCVSKLVRQLNNAPRPPLPPP